MTDNQNWRIEQHVGTIMQALVIGLLAWSLKTNVDTSAQLGVLQAEVRALQTTVQQGTNDRFRGSDATREFGAVWAEFQRREVRISRLEGDVSELKAYHQRSRNKE